MPLGNHNSINAFFSVEFFFGNRVDRSVWEIDPIDAKAEVTTKPTLFLFDLTEDEIKIVEGL